MHTRSSDENSVCLSARLSNACIVTKRKKSESQSRYSYHAKDYLVYFSEKKNGWWGRPLLPEISGQPAPVGAKSPIFDLFSLVAPQPYDLAKEVLLKLIESPLRAFQWAQDGHRTLFLSPQRVAQKRKVSKIWTISCAITPKKHEIVCQLLLITNRKLHTGFRLIPTSMTLNDLERRNSPYFALSPNSIVLLTNYVIVVEDRPIMSVKYCLPFTVFHFWL